MIVVSLIFMGIISFLIAEFIGASKHIGRRWSFALSFTGFIVVGLVASILSPSAKNKPTKGHTAHLVLGVLLLIHGVLTNIMFLVQANPVGISQSLMFICFGIYLILLSKGKIKNNTAKYYFTDLKFSKIKEKPINDIVKTSKPLSHDTILNEEYYYVRLNESNSEPLTFQELKELKIRENTHVWRKGLEKWVLAKDLKELENIVVFEPPIFEEKIDENISILNNEFLDNKEEILEKEKKSINWILVFRKIYFITFLLGSIFSTYGFTHYLFVRLPKFFKPEFFYWNYFIQLSTSTTTYFSGIYLAYSFWYNWFKQKNQREFDFDKFSLFMLKFLSCVIIFLISANHIYKALY